MMTREEHVAWCKRRALEYLPGDPREAVMSMLSDMNKRHETRELIRGPLGMMGLMEAACGTPESVRRYIEGFN